MSDPTTRFLQGPWLDGVDPALRLTIWGSLVARAEPVKTCLLDQGKPNDQLWFVAAGSVAIERTRAAGTPEVLVELEGPAIYGTTTFFRESLPTMTLRAITPIEGWTLDRRAYQQLRRDNPAAAEALALTVVRVLGERFDMLDQRLTRLMDDHRDDHHRVTEWANFRARLFEEPSV